MNPVTNSPDLIIISRAELEAKLKAAYEKGAQDAIKAAARVNTAPTKKIAPKAKFAAQGGKGTVDYRATVVKPDAEEGDAENKKE